MRILAALMFTTLFLSSFAHAGPARGVCEGKVSGKRLVFRVFLQNALDKNSGSGTLFFDNREVAKFEGEDFSINIVLFKFKGRNNRGDTVDGKVTNMANWTGVINSLNVPAYGLNFSNVPMRCKLI